MEETSADISRGLVLGLCDQVEARRRDQRRRSRRQRQSLRESKRANMGQNDSDKNGRLSGWSWLLLVIIRKAFTKR